MIRLLIRTVVFVISAAVGLVVTSLLIDDFTVHAGGFIVAVLVFAVIQSVIAPFVAKVASRNASFLLGGAGLIATLIALFVATVVSDGLSIRGGVVTWIAATVVVWLVTGLATLLLPVILVKAGVDRRRDENAGR